MQLPQVTNCVLCEGVRLEKYNKLSLLGYYGVLPNVEVHLQTWGGAIEKLLFLMSLRGGEGTFKATANVLNPDGTSLVVAADAPLVIDKSDAASLGTFTFVGLVFKQKGQHTFQLLIDGKEAYRNTFNVDAGDPSLFR